jgi:hypothetical protein
MNATYTIADQDLDDWWAVLVIRKDKTVAPLTVQDTPPDDPSGIKIRVYRKDHWDPRFEPRFTAHNWKVLQDLVRTWAGSPDCRKAPIAVAAPAALIRALWNTPAVKYDDVAPEETR